MRRRHLLGCALGLLAALVWLSVTALPAAAYSQSRLLLHRAAVGESGITFADPRGDVKMVGAVFGRAAVAAAVVASVVAGGGDASALLAAVCGPTGGRRAASANGLAPGDLLSYARAGGIRVAMVVTEAGGRGLDHR